MHTELLLQMSFHLVGGLGIFLVGLKYMQQGLQVVAGSRIRRMINAVTSNHIFATGVGLLVTMLVQSSSVTSVMVIGLVNSELMALEAALGILVGANIGTTITGWILALKIGKYGLPILGVAAFGWLFLRSERSRYVALSILGIGMIFFGLELMKNGFQPVRNMPEFVAWFQMFAANDYLGVLKSALVGCVATFIVQSSSATLGIVIALANTGVIDFQTAAALVLGTNIGTTITAYLASLGADDVNAKRTAYFHILFNVCGVAVVTTILLPLYVPFIVTYVMGGLDPNVQTTAGTFPYMTAGIASVHTVFNITTTLLVLPFITPIAQALCRLIPDRRIRHRAHLTHLEFDLAASPVAAIEESRSEIRKMDGHIRNMFDGLRTFITSSGGKSELTERIFERERIIDNVQLEITKFLTDLLAEEMSHAITQEARTQLRLADEYESVSDYITNVLKVHLRLREAKAPLSPDQSRELLELHDVVGNYFDTVRQGLGDGDWRYLEAAEEFSAAITAQIRELRDRHWHHLSRENIEPLVSTSYMDIANAYRRIKDHLLNIAEAIVGEKPTKGERPAMQREDMRREGLPVAR